MSTDTSDSPYAGFIRRLMAGAVDGIFYCVILGIAFFWAGAPVADAIAAQDAEAIAETTSSFHFVLAMMVIFIPVMKVGLEASPARATPGKIMLDMAVTDTYGSQISPLEAILRNWPLWILAVIALGTYAGGADEMTALFTELAEDPDAAIDAGAQTAYEALRTSHFVVMAIAVVSFLAITVTHRKQALHDMIARTLVVNT